MQEKIKTSFGRIHAEPDLKDSTREFLFRKMSGHTRTSTHRNLLTAAACLVLVLAVLGGARWAYFTPVAAVSIALFVLSLTP